MLSATAITSGVSRVAAMLSPVKNPCRIRVAPQAMSAAAASSSPAPATTWYRFDPYVSKVLPSPMKTTMSPVKATQEVQAQPAPHKNSLFAAPVKATAPTTVKPRSFLSAVSEQSAPVAAPFTSRKAPTKSESGKTHYAILKFKHETATFIAPFRVAVGDYVFVTGDRGEDVGVIQEITTDTPSYPVPNKILRRATTTDVQKLHAQRTKEAETARQVQQLAGSLGLNMEVVDTEFQFDGNKLTVFFDSRQNHTDFRKLQRGLFREHRCRIWLSHMDEVAYNIEQQKVRRTR